MKSWGEIEDEDRRYRTGEFRILPFKLRNAAARAADDRLAQIDRDARRFIWLCLAVMFALAATIVVDYVRHHPTPSPLRNHAR